MSPSALTLPPLAVGLELSASAAFREIRLPSEILANLVCSATNPAPVPVQLKVEFWAKGKGKSCRRSYQEQDDEARATKLERRGKDPGVAPTFD